MSISLPKSKVEIALKYYSNEVHKALATYLFWKTINEQASSDDKTLARLNRSPQAWIFTRYAHQVSLFMTLGRVFDTDGDAFSIDDLLKCCISEIDVFSKDALRIRKSEAPNSHEWLDEYINEAYEPSCKDFKKLRGEVAKVRKTFESKYKPIRHKIFAHNDKELMDSRDKLWERTNIEEFESILYFLYDIEITIRDAYHNGVEPMLRNRTPDIKRYTDDYNQLFNLVKRPY